MSRTILLLLGAALWATGAESEEVEVYVSPGATVILPCHSTPPPRTPLTIHWTKRKNMTDSTVWRMERSGMEFRGSGEGKRSHCPHSGFPEGDFSLRIEKVREHDEGVYLCRVRGGFVSVDRTVLLRVIAVLASPSVPVEGSPVSLSCSVTPWPQGAKVSWHVNNRPLPLSRPGSKVTREGRSLELVAVVPEERGSVFSCVVHHHGDTGTASHTLAVRGIMSPARDSTVFVAVGAAVSLPCVFTEALSAQQSGWERETEGAVSPVLRPSSLAPFSSQDVSLQLAVAEERDAGMYRCYGQVEGKRVERRVRLVTAKVSVTTFPLTLTCELSNNTGVQRYEWSHVIFDSNGTRLVTPLTSGPSNSFLVTGRSQEVTTGEFLCEFYGAEGILGNASFYVPIVGHQEGAPEAGGSSGHIAMVTTMSVLFVVLLLITGKMYRNHRRRVMILQYPALETVIHSSFPRSSPTREDRKKVTEAAACADV
ncbi:lymphocyte activation gene 3 protein [Amia ocellicauda]|uniref:lymphocyte activation gene 3 protein n=1 Tax=Amia ocellicauda TaxID=2972642 RepID=UPI003463A91B